MDAGSLEREDGRPSCRLSLLLYRDRMVPNPLPGYLVTMSGLSMTTWGATALWLRWPIVVLEGGSWWRLVKQALGGPGHLLGSEHTPHLLAPITSNRHLITV